MLTTQDCLLQSADVQREQSTPHQPLILQLLQLSLGLTQPLGVANIHLPC